MLTVGLLVRFTAKPGKEGEVAAFVAGALELAEAESGTPAWYGIRLGAREFGVFDAFAGEGGRDAHLNGKIAAALFASAPELLDGMPRVEKVDVLASKRPSDEARPASTHVGIVARVVARPGLEAKVASFMRDALPLAEAEPATSVWYAFKIGDNQFGIFDAFADEAGRQAHLSGKIASALMAHASELLSEPPRIEAADVLAAKY